MSLGIVPVAAGLAIVIFMADILTHAEIVVAFLYVGVLLVLARFSDWRVTILAFLGCVGLTVWVYFLEPPQGPETPVLVNRPHDTVFSRDMNDVIAFWNRAAEELYGWNSEEAVGRVAHELLGTSFPLPLDRIMEELLR